ncbi:hypothetical protein [Hymenobacter agri]
MALSSRIKHGLLWVVLAVFDVFVYVALGVALMNYDDKHDDSQSDYGSWESMTAFDKSASILMTVWNVVNALALVYLIYSSFRKLKSRAQLSSR